MATVHLQVSITFDPFLYLPVPLPQKQKVLPIFYFAREPHSKPVKVRSQPVLLGSRRDPGLPPTMDPVLLSPQFLVSISKENSSASEVLDSLSQSVHVKPENLRLAEVCLSFQGSYAHGHVSVFAVRRYVCTIISICTCTHKRACDCTETGGVLLVEAWLKPGIWAM